jgi:hypothetical protein
MRARVCGAERRALCVCVCVCVCVAARSRRQPHLLKLEGEGHNRHTMPRCFVHAVQPAVRHKGARVGVAQHILWCVRVFVGVGGSVGGWVACAMRRVLVEGHCTHTCTTHACHNGTTPLPKTTPTHVVVHPRHDHGVVPQRQLTELHASWQRRLLQRPQHAARLERSKASCKLCDVFWQQAAAIGGAESNQHHAGAGVCALDKGRHGWLRDHARWPRRACVHAGQGHACSSRRARTALAPPAAGTRGLCAC